MLRDRNLIPLSHQHQHALALCVQIDRAIAAGTGSTLAVLASSVVQQFDSEMREHFYLEEQVLFPVLSQFGTLCELVRNLIAEHRTLEVLRDQISEASDENRLADFARLLRLHVRKEEGVLFEEAQRLLSRQQLADIGMLLAVTR